jgi:hypothetical protein
MSGKNFALVFFTFLLCLSFGRCRKESLGDPVPVIKYMGYSKVSYQNFPTDSIILVNFEFEDGDGDIGLTLADTAQPFRIGDPFYYNVFAEYLSGKNGVYTYVINGSDTLHYNDRITNIQPDTRNKSISGNITLKIEPIIGTIIPDTIKLNIFIVDKALHKSNVITTGGIPVNL